MRYPWNCYDTQWMPRTCKTLKSLASRLACEHTESTIGPSKGDCRIRGPPLWGPPGCEGSLCNPVSSVQCILCTLFSVSRLPVSVSGSRESGSRDPGLFVTRAQDPSIYHRPGGVSGSGVSPESPWKSSNFKPFSTPPHPSHPSPPSPALLYPTSQAPRASSIPWFPLPPLPGRLERLGGDGSKQSNL